MKLHVFNPEHDIALASNLTNFTAPHAGRQLRADLGYLPALWADAADLVLVDNVEEAEHALRRLAVGGKLSVTGHFVDKDQLARLPIDAVEPWGWDLALRRFLLRHGVQEACMPGALEMGDIRNLSHRRTAAWLLAQLQGEGCIGEARECRTADEVKALQQRWGQVVLKAPWSSSGRGLRFVNTPDNIALQGWLHNLLQQQGSVMVEPYYRKVKDFGVEFESDGAGSVRVLGLSLFHTSNGAYTGNILASEEEKIELLTRYIPAELIQFVEEKICQCLGPRLAGKYRGPFGIDMMVVAREDGDGFLLHPCVEINLRRTMGHVAIALTQVPPAPGILNVHQPQRVMQLIYLNNSYKLKIRRL